MTRLEEYSEEEVAKALAASIYESVQNYIASHMEEFEEWEEKIKNGKGVNYNDK